MKKYRVKLFDGSKFELLEYDVIKETPKTIVVKCKYDNKPRTYIKFKQYFKDTPIEALEGFMSLLRQEIDNTLQYYDDLNRMHDESLYLKRKYQDNV